jgi:hypothetical protein
MLQSQVAPTWPVSYLPLLAFAMHDGAVPGSDDDDLMARLRQMAPLGHKTMHAFHASSPKYM